MSEPASSQPHTDSGPVEVVDVHETNCCVVGGGPAGVMLSLLLARQGVPVTLLEAHHDFDRDFRGDTVHPVTLEVLDQLGLADRLLQLPHGEMHELAFHASGETITVLAGRDLKTKFPFVAMLPQARFLEFVAEEAKKYPCFRLVMGANVQRLVQEGEEVRGVRYRDKDNAWHEVRAPLTIGADGRFSRIRQLAGIEVVGNAPPMDVLWFRLPRHQSDGEDTGGFYLIRGHLLILLNRDDEWQIAYVYPKGGYQKIKAAGIEHLRKEVAEAGPLPPARLDHLQSWKQVTVLSVESSMASCWHQPGLLLIGDAAHVMSPVGGVGINIAIQDAVEAANELGPLLKKGTVRRADLAAFQRRRQWVARLVQRLQGMIQKRVVAEALDTHKPFKVPLMLRILPYVPLLRAVPARVFLFAIKRVRIKEVISL